MGEVRLTDGWSFPSLIPRFPGNDSPTRTALPMTGLLSAFQGYLREHSEWWVERSGHRETGPQLVLHAYPQRVANSGGRIGRGYAVGRQRTALPVEWPLLRDRNPARISKDVIECKVLGGKAGLENLISEGESRQLRIWTDPERSRDTC